MTSTLQSLDFHDPMLKIVWRETKRTSSAAVLGLRTTILNRRRLTRSSNSPRSNRQGAR